MEPGSGSLTESASSKHSFPPPSVGGGSFNGLKFGKKIYFQEAKSGHGSSSKSSQVPGRKGGGRGHQQQPARCQVEGCRVDLNDVKAYYSRHKVCRGHSKSPKVIVNGLEQRFCQQCSRFHLLPEFDQGKRSCRRRLAGHNERRRKSQHGSALSSGCRRPVPTLSENSSRAEGFLLDVSAYARLPPRDARPTGRSSEWLPGIETYPMERSFPFSWQNAPQSPSSSLSLQSSTAGRGFASAGIPQGQCFNGVDVTNTTCALSLLSSQQQWGSRNQGSSVVLNHSVNADSATLDQSAPLHGAAMNKYPNPILGYKGCEASSSSHEMGPILGRGQPLLFINDQFSNELELSETQRQYTELDHSRGYGSSTRHMHWSL